MRPHTKFGSDRFSRFDVNRLQTKIVLWEKYLFFNELLVKVDVVSQLINVYILLFLPYTVQNPSIGMGSSEPQQNLGPIGSDVSAFIGLKQQDRKGYDHFKTTQKDLQKKEEKNLDFFCHK